MSGNIIKKPTIINKMPQTLFLENYFVVPHDMMPSNEAMSISYLYVWPWSYCMLHVYPVEIAKIATILLWRSIRKHTT